MKVNRYIKKGRKYISGWLSRDDAEIISAILDYQTKQNRTGSVVEIGAHHGKSFILLALCNFPNSNYVIDIFSNQNLNLDRSGSGDKKVFIENLKNHGVDIDKVHIDERLSSDVQPADIISSVGYARFFHIDGGHHLDAVEGDISLATKSIIDAGVIAIDDVFRPEWPEVSIAALGNKNFSKHDIIPFAIGFNKTYFCKAEYAEDYRNLLLNNPFLEMFFQKTYQVSKDEVLVFQRYPLPEWKFSLRLWYYLQLYHPDFAFVIFRIWKHYFGN